MQLKNVTLELSAKPFYDDSDGELRRVSRKIFEQWRSLTDRADLVSVMLWIADGSEILEYTGDLDAPLEWDYWCGVANPNPNPPAGLSARAWRNTHLRPVRYRPGAGPRTYRWLRRLIEVLRETGSAVTGKPIRIGATFDNGPEFAISDFKYRRHPEIAQAHTLYPHSFVVCSSTLHADARAYAGYPGGIPEGTSLGEFLGRQFRCFARDLGYDYIWLSNGMGFGAETWGITGTLFDKRSFHPERVPEAVETMLRFWRDFRRELPGVAIETRGSNYSAGLEMATDGCPLRRIYTDFDIAPPVNSPWAALNYNTGVELAAWMSHIAEAPDGRFPFRFYVHDPWFRNSPWLDRYGREPWDIYLPLSIGRVNGGGAVEVPSSVSILSVDDSDGRMPDQVPLEVIPHLLHALDTAPDRIAPLLWVYPFEEYDRAVAGSGAGARPAPIFCEEWYLGAAIQCGLPLNTVISTGNFRALAATAPERFAGVVLTVPVSGVNGETLAALRRAVAAGAECLFYGPEGAADPELRRWIGIELAEPLRGEVSVRLAMEPDRCRTGQPVFQVPVVEQFNAGGLAAVAGPEVDLLAVAEQGRESRLLASVRTLENGSRIGFVRALIPCDPEVRPGRELNLLGADRAFPSERLMRLALAAFGWKFRFTGFEPATLLPRCNLSRHDNAFFFAVFAPDTSCEMRIATPLGAPVLTEQETLVEEGCAVWHPGKCVRRECRCFVRQRETSVVGCKIGTPSYPGVTARRFYSGLRDAEVRIFVPETFETSFEAVNTPPEEQWNLLCENLLPVEWEDSPFGRCAVVRHVTGLLRVAW